jgi:hypothetical protein
MYTYMSQIRTHAHTYIHTYMYLLTYIHTYVRTYVRVESKRTICALEQVRRLVPPS